MRYTHTRTAMSSTKSGADSSTRCANKRWVLCWVLLALLSGCESSFDPFAESDLHFTLLGYLDSDADAQFVRVIPYRPVVDRLKTAVIDASFRSIDLDTGASIVWSDSVVQFSDSSYGHVFWSRFRPVPGHKYRIEVERSDGGLTWAETLVPQHPVDPDSVYGALNESADFAPLYWPGVRNVIEADVLYDIGPYSCSTLQSPPPVDGRWAFRIPYKGDFKGQISGNDWTIQLQLWSDQDSLKTRLRSVGAPARGQLCAYLYRLEVRLATPSAEFSPPGGIWDRELLIYPGTLSNVHGGLGFVGSVVRTSVDWTLAPIAQLSLGYIQ